MAAHRLLLRLFPLALLGVMSCVPAVNTAAPPGPETSIGARTAETQVRTIAKDKLRSIPPNATPFRINFSTQPYVPTTKPSAAASTPSSTKSASGTVGNSP